MGNIKYFWLQQGGAGSWTEDAVGAGDSALAEAITVPAQGPGADTQWGCGPGIHREFDFVSLFFF